MQTKPEAGRGRGRGRGRGGARQLPPAASPPETVGSSSTLTHDAIEDATMSDASPAPGSTPRLSSSTAAAARDARPVGGMLRSSEYARRPPSKLKFVPNTKRKLRPAQQDDDDVDVKMEDVEASFPLNGQSGRGTGGPRSRGRGRGQSRERKEIEMTASGPMAQGPGALKSGPIASTSALSSRKFESGQFDDDPDASDLDEDDDDDEGARTFKLRARDLSEIGEENEMAPVTLPRDPSVVKMAVERRKIRAEKRLNAKVKVESGEETASSNVTSKDATPAVEEIEDPSKNTIGEEEHTETTEDMGDYDLENDFDLNDDASRERLYIFQFPRKFPRLVSTAKEKDREVEKEDVKPSLNGSTPDWGRAGSRAAKSTRWPVEQGRMGELCIRKSGKVSLVVNGDLEYEILAAVQPSFLQEIVILNHDPASVPGQRDNGSGEQEDKLMSDPNHAILTMGQTFKKFIAVPDARQLLDKVIEQEQKDKEEAKRRAAIKKERF